MMTARENLLMAYHHEEPYWVPSQYLDQEYMPVYCHAGRGEGIWKVCRLFRYLLGLPSGDEGPMVTKGTRRLEDIEDWRETLPMPDCESWPWEESAARDTAGWDRKNKISSVIMINGLFEQLHSLTGFEDALCFLLTAEDAVCDFLDALADFRIRQIQLIAKYYKPDKIQFHDDYGRPEIPLCLWKPGDGPSSPG